MSLIDTHIPKSGSRYWPVIPQPSRTDPTVLDFVARALRADLHLARRHGRRQHQSQESSPSCLAHMAFTNFINFSPRARVTLEASARRIPGLS